MQRLGRRLAGTGAAFAGLMLTVAGCSSSLPLGAAPEPSHLAAPITLQPLLSRSATAAGTCPAGYTTITGPAAAYLPTTPVTCFRKLGGSATFTTAAVTVQEVPAPAAQPVGSTGQAAAPQGQSDVDLVVVTLPAADKAALTAITRKVAGTQDQLAVIVDGQTWDAPTTPKPLTNGQFTIQVQTKSQADQLKQILLQSS